MYDPFVPANYYLKKSKEANLRPSAASIELLIYFAHGWHLAIEGKGLINEPVKAWRHGPVIESIHKFYNRGSLDLYSTIDENKISELKESHLQFLDGIWQYYANRTEVELLNLCHEHGSPWESVYGKSSRDIVIDDKRIKLHYRLLHMNHPAMCDLDDPISAYD